MLTQETPELPPTQGCTERTTTRSNSLWKRCINTLITSLHIRWMKKYTYNERYWLWSSPKQYWRVWAQPQLLAPLKIKKAPRIITEVWQTTRRLGWASWWGSFTTWDLCQDWGRWLFYLMCSNQQRESGKNEEIIKYIPNKRRR